MGITFTFEGGPTVPVQDIDWDGNLLFNEDGTPKIAYEENVHSLNVASMNAAHMIQLLDLPYKDGCGAIAVADIPNVRRKLFGLLSRDVDLSRENLSSSPKLAVGKVEGDVVSLQRSGLTVVDCGYQDEGMRRRFAALLDIVVAAQEHNAEVYYC